MPHVAESSTPDLYSWKADLSASIATDTGCCASADWSAVSSCCGTSVKPVIVTAGLHVVLHVPVMPEPDVYG